jgi:anti-anti-sigma regulatory factor
MPMPERGAITVAINVAGVRANAWTVDALARLQLAARRHGCQIRLRGTSPELRELVVFMGLGDVLPEWP